MQNGEQPQGLTSAKPGQSSASGPVNQQKPTLSSTGNTSDTETKQLPKTDFQSSNETTAKEKVGGQSPPANVPPAQKPVSSSLSKLSETKSNMRQHTDDARAHSDQTKAPARHDTEVSSALSDQYDD
ncbi:hypothetical protein CC80DRAFT_552801 [Byssothecium circinans]|uniref:Uncharacterized protein n=1 Tax=Byssothecium circinans TaxID=147558 RepID=A0A6A5THH4_9PLEO|nr:hypothetical protein CC80DRAFT_552801 [Byssothecium circinans]